MAGEGNKVGEVYVEIKATGAENVAKEVQKAQAMATAPGGFTQLPAWAGSAGANSTMTGGGGFSPQIKTISATTAALTEQTGAVKAAAVANEVAAAAAIKHDGGIKGMGQSLKAAVLPLNTLRQGVMSVASSFIGWGTVIAVVTGALSVGIDKLGEWGRVLDELIKKQDDVAKSNREMADQITNGPGFDVDKKMEALKKGNAEEIKLLEERLKKEGWTKEAVARAVSQRRKELDAEEAKAQESTQNEANRKAGEVEIKEYESVKARRIEMENEAGLAQLDGAAKVAEQGRLDIEKLEAEKRKQQDETIRAEYDGMIEAQGKINAAKLADATALEQKQKEAAEKQAQHAQDVARRSAQAIGEAYSKATADIMANFANQQSQSIEELAQYVKLIAEGVGR